MTQEVSLYDINPLLIRAHFVSHIVFSWGHQKQCFPD